MRKLSILVAAMLALTFCALAEDDASLPAMEDVETNEDGDTDISLEELLSGADPLVVDATLIRPPVEGEATSEPVSIYEADGSVLITITGTGDFTIGGDSRKSTDIFNNELKRQDGDLNFTMRNVRDILAEDDLTIVNFEGTLTETTYIPSSKRENEFLFSAPPSYVSMLSDNGVEAVSLENNHVMDHGEDAYQETMDTLSGAGIVYSNSTHLGVYEAKGVPIAMLSYLCIDRYEQLWDQVPADIAAAKAEYPIVIVSFHWGNELDYSPTNNQIRMGRLAVDAGADLVLGHHSHRLNPIEQYKGVYICYSLGNFCFSGNNKPNDMTSFMFQTRFRVLDGQVTNEGFRIIPIRISSRTDRNDFIPTPLTKETAIDSVLTTLKDNGRKLEYAVESYPLTWPE